MIQHRAGITMVFVTHGQDEALSLADRIAIMRDGRLEQVGPPDTVYRQPHTEFVAGFIGQMNLIEGDVHAGRLYAAGLSLPVSLSEGPATLALRPEDLGLQCASGEAGAKVMRVTDFGTHLSVELHTADRVKLKATAEPGPGWAAGMHAELRPRKFAVYREGKLCDRPLAQGSGELPASIVDLR